MALRVVQWTTGNVGKRSVRAVTANPDLELVGCCAWSDDKVGTDAGELCGIDPVGIAATNDVEALLALKPDVVVYNPMWPNTDEVVRILEAGVNVVTTAAFINGRSNLADRERILAACEQGGSTIFGTGISPGFVELVGIATANICDRVDKITIDEGSDTTLYDSPATELPCGFGRHMDDPELPGMAAKGTAVFGEAVALVADAVGIELDEIVCDAEYAKATEDVVMDSWTIRAGHVAGVYASWQGRLGERTVVELNVRWRKGQTLDPDWPIKEGHVIRIDGRHTVTVTLEYLPPPDFEATTFADFMVLGMIMTAMPAVNAIPHVVAAPPGIATYADLPLTLPRGVVSGIER
ncbi:MAG: NAD(P)H-dependent amine dehydrogenase family protein [Ilumatobacteraceae bacterium]